MIAFKIYKIIIIIYKTKKVYTNNDNDKLKKN